MAMRGEAPNGCYIVTMPETMTTEPHGVPRELFAQLLALLGPAGILTGADTEPFAVDWRQVFRGSTPAVLRPASTAEVAGIVRLCGAAGVRLVPQGGNTGLVGGASVDAGGGALLLNLARMNRIRVIDPVDGTMIVDAGVTLAAAQAAAREAGRMLPLSIASEGSAQIGGVLATNAGGNMTVRYGNARDLVLGLEVVLPDGQVFEGLRRLRKDNTGYSLRHLFVGSEGTLGIITASVLRLVPVPRTVVTALCALPSAEAALALLGRVMSFDPGALSAFEYMSRAGLELVVRLIDGVSLPFEAMPECCVLLELTSGREGPGLREGLEETLAQAMASDEVADAVLAESETQRTALWRLREEHTDAQARAGASVKNDVSVPVSHVPRFLAEATAAVTEMMPGIRVAPFGHLGDGNIHFNVVAPEDMDRGVFLGRSHALMDVVAAVVKRHDGSFSAEHGVGRLKSYLMETWRGGVELDLMRRIRSAFDPDGLLNPGKLLPGRE